MRNSSAVVPGPSEDNMCTTARTASLEAELTNHARQLALWRERGSENGPETWLGEIS